MEISLRQIAYFLRLIDKGSFTGAAGALGITQPALSIAISQLEKALGAPLVERGAQPIALTEAGQLFHRYALRVHRDLAEARDELAAINSGTIGRLDLCLGPSATGSEVAGILAEMTEEFPGLEIHIQMGVMPAVAERIRSNEFSVYVGTVADGFDDSTLNVLRLTTLPLIVAAGARHPLASRREVHPQALLDYPWIAIGNLDSNLPDWRRPFEQAGLTPPRPAIDIRNIALVRTMLAEGRFLTILPVSMVRTDLADGVIADVTPPGFGWRLRLEAVTRAGLTPPAAARIFLDRLQAAFTPGN